MMIAAFALLAALSALPGQYHGQWTLDPAACGKEDTQGVLLGPTTIEFYEARGVVQSVSEGAKGVSARVRFVGEGRNWDEAIRLHPLPQNKLEVTALGRTQTLTRCASTEG